MLIYNNVFSNYFVEIQIILTNIYITSSSVINLIIRNENSTSNKKMSMLERPVL